MSKKGTRSVGRAPQATATARHAAAVRPATVRPRSSRVPYAAAAGIVVLVFLWAYSPGIRTGFVFDDTNQIFAIPSSARAPLSGWIGPVRPVLMFTYWLNVQI